MSESQSKEEWQQLARTVARKINTAWWLETLRLPLVITALVLACAILFARREVTLFPWREVALGIFGIMALVGLISWLMARRKFESADHALVRVETAMKLRSALSAAQAGITPWPHTPKVIDDGTRWHWPRLLMPFFAALALISMSVLLPVSARTDQLPTPDEPQAWKDLEADIEILSENDTVQEQYLEELQERVDELRKKNEDEWFSHSSLEATDALKKAHSSEVEQLQRHLRNAERSLHALQKSGHTLNDNARERLLNEFQDALHQMGHGAMKPNADLLEQLQQLDPQNLGNLNQEQLDQLRENMRQRGQECGQCNGGNGPGEGGPGEDWIDDLLNQGQEGQNPGEGNQPSNPGQGGLKRGPGSNPNVLGQLGQDLSAGDMEGLKSRDLSRTLPGDLLQLMDGEHEVNKEDLGLRAGGGVADEGRGGDRVWKDALLPHEKKALKKFFK